MIASFLNRIFHRKPVEQSDPAKEQAERLIQTAQLEARIEAIGRERVFALARLHGWSGGMPVWAWNMLCAEIEHADYMRAKEE